MKPDASPDFIRQIIRKDLESGRHTRIVTRFPPEPNGYLHIGHAKAFCLNFGVAKEFGGRCHLRFDDTNPAREEAEFTAAIREDVRWLGWDWGEHEYYASDYFEQLYEWALRLIREGKAYVDDQTAAQIRETRGTLTEPGRNSPFRDRPVEENLDLFERMGKGEFPDGSRVLRAKIDMASANLNLRDPVMYRILHATHPRTGDAWCLYPMYDWAHGQSDSIEGVTHSLCSLEFENHRPLYDWFLDQLGVHHPRQYEFARFNLTHTVMSKRKLRELVEEGHVEGWDDPRMPTLRGMRRRGYPPEAIRSFIEEVGIGKRENLVEIELLEHKVREDLNRRAPRRMGVLDPIKVVLVDYPEDRVEEFDAGNNPEDPSAGTRKVPFSRKIWIERADFREDPPRKFWRLSPGREVRLRNAYLVTCTGVVKDGDGTIREIHCTHDPASRGGNAPDGRKVKSTLHWVSARHAIDAEVRLYERLFPEPQPEADEDWKAHLDPNSRKVLTGCKLEPSLAGAEAGFRLQLERLGYFCVDAVESRPGRLVLHRTVTLRDSWAKIQRREAGKRT